MNTSSARWRYQFAEQQKQKIKNTEEAFDKSASVFLKLNTGQDYTKPLYNYFQTR